MRNKFNNQFFRQTSFITLLLIFYITNDATTQAVNKYISDVILPSPNANAMGNFVDVPVDQSTGVANISVPIYDLNYGDISVPISLSYHAGGVQLEETASWVGQNWNLNAGGMVTRVIAGIADDDPLGYYHFGPGIQAFIASQCSYCLFASGSRDSEPDVFTVSYPGGSFKFYFSTDPNKRIQKIEDNSDEVIEVIVSGSDQFYGFRLIDTKGNVYLFGKETVLGTDNLERSQYSFTGNTINYITSWQLSKITTSDSKRSITFNYVDETYTYQSKANRSYVFGSNGQVGILGGYNSELVPHHPQWNTTMTSKRLSSITTPEETISFTATNNRQDITNSKQLDVIEIKPAANNLFWKKIEFTYDYFVDNNYSSYEFSKRLQLVSVQEKSYDGTITKNPYIFEYFGNVVAGKKFLPFRLSHQIDHWGYYNGKTGNESLDVNVPSKSMIAGTGPMSYGSANRDVDPNYSNHGSISKVTYPTKGFSSFTYEPNTYPDSIEQPKTYIVNITTCGTPSPACCGSLTTSSIVSMNASQISAIKFDLEITNPNFCSSGSNCYSILFQVFNGASQVGISYTFNACLPDQFGVIRNIPVSQIATLQPGINYTFKITSSECKGSLLVHYTTKVFGNVNGPGIRIKKIATTDNITNTVVETNYEYALDNSSISSGKMLNPKVYYTKRYDGIVRVVSTPSPGGTTYTYYIDYKLQWFDRPEHNLSSFFSNSVIYSRIKEYKSNQGNTILRYDNSVLNNYVDNLMACAPGQNPPNPLLSCSDGSCYDTFLTAPTGARGRLNSQAIYSQTGVLLDSLKNDYNISTTTGTSKMFKIDLIACDMDNYWINPYRLVSSRIRLVSSKKFIDGVSTVTNYTYDPGNRHSMPVTISLINSDTKTYLMEYAYIHDYFANSSIRDTLLKKNIISEPFNVYNKVDNVIVSGHDNIYAWYNLNTGAFQGVNSANAFVRFSQAYQQEYTFDVNGSRIGTGRNLAFTINNYDSNGFMSDMNIQDWDPEVIEWNANGTMKKRTFQSHVKKYTYYTGTKFLDTFTDIDGQIVKYEYDKIQRLTKVRERANNLITDINYNFYSVSDPYNWLKIKKTYTAVSGSSLNTLEEKQYLDGLGRPLETVQKNQANGTLDLVVGGIVYDNNGRVIRKYKPYQSPLSSGAYISIPTSHSFDSLEYEASPLNRQSGIIPANWYKTTSTYGTNGANEVKRWVGATQNLYDANSLFKVTTTDASGRISITFIDKKGRTILQKETKTGASPSEIAETYSIYDNKDRISKIIPPGATPSTQELIFTYLYDQSNNVTNKKVPGKNGELMMYNSRDLLTFYQDGNLNSATYNENGSANQWMMNKYDNYGRLISNGFYYPSKTPLANNDTATFWKPILYTTYGTVGIDLGKVKQSRSLILGNYTNSTTWLETNNFYDNYGRLRYATGNNHLNTALDAQCNYLSYDFADNVLFDTLKTKNAGGTQYSIINKSTYDYLGRVSSGYQKIDALAEKHIYTNAYNFRGELSSKSLAYNVDKYLQKTDFTYNTQGWLTAINGPLTSGQPSGSNVDEMDVFNLKLNYDNGLTTVTGQTPTLDKSGNISQMLWQNRGMDVQGYFFDYDFLNRANNNKYFELVGGASVGTYNQKYNELLTYDIRGNISTLTRNTSNGSTGSTLIDNLTYTYPASSNVLSKIADASTNAQGFNINGALSSATYAYDLNGNMYTDPYKKITSAKYYYHNNPKDLTINSNFLKFTYDASGTKLRKQVLNSSSQQILKQDYVSGVEYRNDTIEAIYHSDGRAVWNGSAWRYEYNVSDHLDD